MQSISLSELLASGLSDSAIADRIAGDGAILAQWQARLAAGPEREAEAIAALEREYEGHRTAKWDRDQVATNERLTVETGIIRWGLKYKIRVWVPKRFAGGGRYRIVGMASTLREARRIRRQMIVKILNELEEKSCRSRQRKIKRFSSG